MMWIFLIISVLSVLYGISVSMIGSGTGFFVIWFVIGAFFAVLAFLTGRHLWHEIPRGILIAAGVLLGAGLVLLTAVEIRILSGFAAAGEPGLSHIIVLGAQVHEDGPSLVLQYRLDKAAAYLSENPETLCIVSGGQGSNEPFSEAEGMKNYLLEKGIAEERILMEDRSMNTSQNIRYSRELLPEGTKAVGIVTNNFHVLRAVSIARKQGLAGAVGIAADSTVVYLPHNMLREFFGIVKDTLTGAM